MVSLMGRGVVVVTVTLAGATTTLSDALRLEAVSRIESGSTEAVCFTADGAGEWVLAAPCDVLLVAEAALSGIEPELITRISDGSGSTDPRTAMLELQWRLSLNGHRVLALDGPTTPRPVSTVVDEQRRVAAILTALAVLPGTQLYGPLTAAVQLYFDLDTIGQAPSLRESVQRRRRVPDRALTRLMEPAVAHLVGAEDRADRERLNASFDASGLRAVLTEPLHVVVVAPDTGPARVRAEQLIGQLDGMTVRLVTGGSGEILQGDTRLDCSLVEQPLWADVIVLVASTFDDVPGAARTDVPVVVDFSTIDVVAWLLEAPLSWHRSTALQELMTRADLVLASNDRQRDVLLGALAGQVRVNAAVYDEDPSLLSLVRTDESGIALADFCRRPVRAADTNLRPFVRPTKPGDLAMAMHYLREGGPAALAGRVAARVKRLHTSRAPRKTR